MENSVVPMTTVNSGLSLTFDTVEPAILHPGEPSLHHVGGGGTFLLPAGSRCWFQAISSAEDRPQTIPYAPLPCDA
jgi:hypothetical protein